jgi:threonine/homoserine/homoserine lactone efflux protein
MTVTVWDLVLYAGALLVLFLTPGPVWVALIARGLSGGFHSAWPLALGVVIGDVMWSVLAILGISWILSVYGGFLEALRWVASAMFLIMGVMLIRHSDKSISQDNRLTRPGMVAGFLAGLAVILGNPKAILFYMGMLPGFFDLSTLRTPDILAIAGLSAVVPLFGNLVMGLSIHKIRGIMASRGAMKRMNVTAGILMLGVAVAIPFF